MKPENFAGAKDMDTAIFQAGKRKKHKGEKNHEHQQLPTNEDDQIMNPIAGENYYVGFKKKILIEKIKINDFIDFRKLIILLMNQLHLHQLADLQSHLLSLVLGSMISKKKIWHKFILY